MPVSTDSMLGQLIAPDIQALIKAKDYKEVRESLSELDPVDIAEAILVLSLEDQALVFRLLPRQVAADVFEYLPFSAQEDVLHSLGQENLAALLNEMEPDDRTAFLEELPGKVTRRLLELLSPEERAVATELLGYPEHSIGRRMTTEYVAVRNEWTVEEVFQYIRKNGQDKETINVIYVIDENERLIDDIRLRQLIFAEPQARIAEISDGSYVTLNANDDQEKAIEVMSKYDRIALPVVDSDGTLVGIVTADDVFDVAAEETTEDMHRMGGMEALKDPYWQVSFLSMVKKRAGWLSLLFLSEMLTATAMGYFENEIQKAVVLALFIPLIISSGGNSGSQATSLIIRALALQDISLRQWFRVFRREMCTGFLLGCILGTIALIRINFWPARLALYGPHYFLVAITVFCALIGVVLFGTIVGAMLPFIFRSLGFDPALSSAPFVATLVDVTGIVIYFSVAMVILHGTLL